MNLFSSVKYGSQIVLYRMSIELMKLHSWLLVKELEFDYNSQKRLQALSEYYISIDFNNDSKSP